MSTRYTAVIKDCRKKDKDDRPAREQEVCLYTHDGKDLLGRHPSEESAEQQERAIQVHKHGAAPARSSRPIPDAAKVALQLSALERQLRNKGLDEAAIQEALQKKRAVIQERLDRKRSLENAKEERARLKRQEELSLSFLQEALRRERERKKQKVRPTAPTVVRNRIPPPPPKFTEEELAQRAEELRKKKMLLRQQESREQWEKDRKEREEEMTTAPTKAPPSDSDIEKQRLLHKNRREWKKQKFPGRASVSPINLVKYNGAYYERVEALQQHDPSKRLPMGSEISDIVSAEFQLSLIGTWLEQAEKVFDQLSATPCMEGHDDKRVKIDKNITNTRSALSKLQSIVQRMSITTQSQQDTIKRFQLALQKLQTQSRTGSGKRIDSMAINDQPKMVKYAGQLYVLAEDEADEMEMDEPEEAEEEKDEEDMEEMELLDALKSNWKTILDKLPDDLEVDEEFEEALNGIDEVIGVMEKIHAEFDAEVPEVDEDDTEEVG